MTNPVTPAPAVKNPVVQKRKVKAILTLITLVVLETGMGIYLLFHPEHIVAVAVIHAVAIVCLYLGVTSVYVISPDHMLACFFLGSYRGTYISGTFATTRSEKTRWRSSKMMQDWDSARRGILGSGFVFALWPLWTIVRFPTTNIQLKLHANQIWTKDIPGVSPKLPVDAKVTIVVRLAPGLEKFVTGFDVLDRGIDLAEECELYDNRWKPDQEEGPTAHVYRGPRLAQIMLEAIESVVLESMRKIGSEYPWRSLDGHDITGKIKDYEEKVLYDLSSWESIFQQGGLLIRRHGEGYPGPAALSIDINVENVQPEDKAALEAQSRPMIETMEAIAQKAKGEGEGDRLKEKATRSGNAPELILGLEAIQQVETANLNLIGSDLVEAGIKALGGKKP